MLDSRPTKLVLRPDGIEEVEKADDIGQSTQEADLHEGPAD